MSTFVSALSGLLSLGLIVALALGVTSWAHPPAGNFLDWTIGITSFAWLVAITTIPWNIHFQAKEVLADADQSRDSGLPIDAQQLSYVRLIAKRGLWIAIGLHVISAIGLYSLAASGISPIGYIGAVAALLLTILRPSVRTYQYLAMRLSLIRNQFRYPREDVLELRGQVNELQSQLMTAQFQLDANNPESIVATQQRELNALRQDWQRLASNVETATIDNQTAHAQLSREARQSIAQLSADSQFLDHVREILRFFKEA
jgi:hypothetical protein